MNPYKWHFIKLQLPNRSWKTYFNPSPARLQRLITKHKPKNCYISLARWLRYKEHNPSYKNLPIGKYELIDIDGQHFKNKKEVKQYFIGIVKLLTEHNIYILENVCTNNTIGGYQILIDRQDKDKLHQLITNNIQLFKKIDFRVFYDPKRVRRMPGTWNSNKGSLAYRVDSLGNPKKQPLNTSFNLPIDYALGMSKKTDDKGDGNIPPPNHNTKARIEIESNLPRYYSILEISSSVSGTRALYVPVLKFNSLPSTRKLINLQNMYKLGDMFLFQYEKGYFAICPKTTQKQRLIKIYKQIKCWYSLSELMKIKQNWIIISNCYDPTKKREIPTFKFIKLLPQLVLGSYSKQHVAWLNKFTEVTYPLLVGNDQPKIYKIECARE